MTEYENFIFILTHSKLEWIGVQEGYAKRKWDDSFQNQLNALAASSELNLDIEVHFIAVQEFFKEQFTSEEILLILNRSVGESYPENSND